MSAKKEKPPKPPKPAKGAKKAPAEGEAPEGEAVEGEEGAPAKKKLAGKTLILFVVLPALLLLGAGGGAAFFLLKPGAEVHADASDAHGKAKKKDGHGKAKDKEKGGHGAKGEADPKAPVVTEGDGVYYVALPQLLVNFSTNDGQPAYLKLKVTLEAPDEEVAHAVEPELPRIMDQYQGFLRELRMDDISGSAGTARLRLELLRRVNLAIAPAQMNAVLIEEMLVQ